MRNILLANILFFLVSVITTTAIAYLLPAIVSRAEQEVLSQYDEVKLASRYRTAVEPLLALFLACVAPVFYAVQSDITLSVFIGLLALVSYIDIMRQWVPDVLIHLLSWYSLSCLALGFITPDVLYSLLSLLLLLLPFLAINAYSWIKNRSYIYASGDIYILLSVGLWLDYRFSLSAAALSILSASIYAKIAGKEKVPFVPFILFSLFVFSTI